MPRAEATTASAGKDRRLGTRPVDDDSNISAMTASVDTAMRDRVLHVDQLPHVLAMSKVARDGLGTYTPVPSSYARSGF